MYDLVYIEERLVYVTDPPLLVQASSSSSSSSDNDDEESDGGDGEEEDEDRPPRRHGDGPGALGSIAVPGGCIRMYWEQKAQAYYAVAHCDCHADCSKSRTFKRSERGKRAQGRPLGFLAAWLKRGLEARCTSAFKHKWRSTVTRQQRRDARVVCQSCAGARVLLQEERPPRSDSEDEPQDEP